MVSKNKQKGNELIEFGLASVLLLPLFLLSFVTSMNLIRGNQTAQLARDIGSLYIHGLDFSLTANQDLAVRLAHGLNLQDGASSSSSDGVIILSQMTYIGTPTCTANGFNSSTCTNQNQYVFTQRLVIGNSSLTTSRLGTPTASINSAGMVQNYLTDSGARTNTGFASIWNPGLTDGQYVYACEVYFTGPNLGLATVGNGATYTRVFF
jgi:hypothetical protein